MSLAAPYVVANSIVPFLGKFICTNVYGIGMENNCKNNLWWFNLYKALKIYKKGLQGDQGVKVD